MHLVSASLEPAEESLDAVETLVSFSDETTVFLRELLPWSIRRNSFPSAKRHEIALAFAIGGGCPGFHGALPERFPRIRDDEIEIDPDGAAESLAGLACPQGIVEGKEIRRRIGIVDIASWAVEVLAERDRLKAVLGLPHGR